MCVITTAMVAGGLTALGSMGAAAATSAATVATATTLTNAALGAAVSAGIGAATGARGRDLWTAAAIGGATAGIGSAAGMAFSGVQTAATTGAASQAATQTATQSATQTAAASESGLNAMQLSSLGMQAASGGVEAYSAYQQGKQEEKALKEQAKLDQIRAGQVQDAATLEKQDLARRQRQTIDSGRAAAAANGVLLESRVESAPAVWEQDAAEELAYESSKIDYNANLQAWGYNQSARTNLINARNARRTGNLRVATSLIKAGAGMASSYAMYNYGSAKQPTISFG